MMRRSAGPLADFSQPGLADRRSLLGDEPQRAFALWANDAISSLT